MVGSKLRQRVEIPPMLAMYNNLRLIGMRLHDKKLIEQKCIVPSRHREAKEEEKEEEEKSSVERGVSPPPPPSSSLLLSPPPTCDVQLLLSLPPPTCEARLEA